MQYRSKDVQVALTLSSLFVSNALSVQQGALQSDKNKQMMCSPWSFQNMFYKLLMPIEGNLLLQGDVLYFYYV